MSRPTFLYVRCVVRVHLHPRVKIPPEELLIHLGSHRAWREGDLPTRSPEEEGPERRPSERAGRNESEARAGSERDAVDADPSCLWGRPRCQAEAIDHAWRSTGILGAACEQQVECATRKDCAEPYSQSGRGKLEPPCYSTQERSTSNQHDMS